MAESRALRAIWDKTPGKPTQAEFAHRFGIGTQGAVALFLSGKTPLSPKAAAGFASGLGCRVEDFSPRLAAMIEKLSEGQSSSMDEFALVRRVDVSVSAGNGALVFEEGSKSALTFRRSFLQEIGVTPASAVIVTVKGHSMEPTIRDGAVILVSTSAKQVIDREIYAFRLDDELFVKRLVKHPDGVTVLSDNPDRDMYRDMFVHENETGFEIIGRALWMGARL